MNSFLAAASAALPSCARQTARQMSELFVQATRCVTRPLELRHAAAQQFYSLMNSFCAAASSALHSCMCQRARQVSELLVRATNFVTRSLRLELVRSSSVLRVHNTRLGSSPRAPSSWHWSAHGLLAGR